MSKYTDWISTWLKTNNPYGECQRAVEELCEAFPELVKTRGHVRCLWGKRAHWWAVAPNGHIVDPTVRQFGGPVVDYEPWTPGEEVRVGKCMECGDDIWREVEDLEKVQRESMCSKDCEKAFSAAMEGW